MRKIPFGLHDDKLYQPEEVPRGLHCNCVCPGCGSKLVAHHGTKKVKYFSHYSTESCAKGFESAIHKAAKQVLLERRKIFVPAIIASARFFNQVEEIEVNEDRKIPGKLVVIDNVEVEKNIGSVIPDLVVSALNKTFFVEIAYTHFVDDEKRRKLKELGIATLEIDLSSLSEIPSMIELAQLVVDEPSNRTWIFNPKEIELNKKIEHIAKQKLANAVKVRQRSKERYLKMNEEEKLTLHLGKMGINRSQIPDYLGVGVRGGKSFSVNAQVWQAAIFEHFIFKNELNEFDVQEVCNWCWQYFRIERVFKNSEKVAIWDFLTHLASLGLLIYQGYQLFTVWTDSFKETSYNSASAAYCSEGDLPF